MYAFVINTLNALIRGLGSVLSAIFSILPSSPFKILDNSSISSYLPTINYFIPVSDIIAIFDTWIFAVGGYYLYQIVLRWIKAVE